tara:strand:+ start:358 stop:579 length:222 start_codon:yes stop_codon:yes gene_type:complete
MAKMKLTLTDDDGRVHDEWDIVQDIDLPDLEELCQSLENAGFYHGNEYHPSSSLNIFGAELEQLLDANKREIE